MRELLWMHKGKMNQFKLLGELFLGPAETQETITKSATEIGKDF